MHMLPCLQEDEEEQQEQEQEGGSKDAAPEEAGEAEEAKAGGEAMGPGGCSPLMGAVHRPLPTAATCPPPAPVSPTAPAAAAAQAEHSACLTGAEEGGQQAAAARLCSGMEQVRLHDLEP